MLHQLDGSETSPAGNKVALSRLGLVPTRRFLSVWGSRLVPMLSGWCSYGFVALVITALFMPSVRGTLQDRRETVDRTQDQDKQALVPTPDDDDKAVQDFIESYRLADGQKLKRIEPPRPRGAELWWKRKFGKNAGSGTEGFGAMSFRYKDPGHLENFVGLFGPATEGYRIVNLPEAIGMDIDPSEIDGDPELLKRAVSGDWIFRGDVPVEQTAAAIESILQRVLRMRIKLSFRPVRATWWSLADDTVMCPCLADRRTRSIFTASNL